MFTVGHSNRTLEEFLELLTADGVALLVDVRTMPRSRHNPQFNRETLPKTLEAHRIAYEHVPGLGGLRHARKDSINVGGEMPAFEATPTTCKPRSLHATWRFCASSRAGTGRRSCVPSECRGGATGR